MKNNTSGMTLIVKTITRLTVGLILIYGIYIILGSNMKTGGAFAGGIIVALSFIHLMLAFGKDAVIKKIDENKGLIFASIAALVFLFLAAMGSRLIPFAEVALAIVVGTGIFVVFLALIALIGERSK